MPRSAPGPLDQIVRQGRAFGVCTVLGTRTLRGEGLPGLLRGTLDRIAVRVLLTSSEADARLFLGDDNPAGATLTRTGQAIDNADGGSRTGDRSRVVLLEAWRDDHAHSLDLDVLTPPRG